MSEERIKEIQAASAKLYEGSVVLNGVVYVKADNIHQYLLDTQIHL
jgi:hypothetical protein